MARSSRASARLLFAITLFALAGCSSWLQGFKSGIVGDDASKAAKTKRSPSSLPTEEAPKPVASRKADPFDGTGPFNEASLWNPDSQDNFYFSKNVLHKIGDLLIVKMEPEVNDSLNLRIASVLGRNSVQQVVADEAGKAAAAGVEQKVGQAIGNENIAKAVGAAAGERTVAALDERPKYVDVDEISVRIMEMLPRNTYRVEGTRRVFVKSTPYTLRYSGVVRDEDVGPSSMIASSKIIDSRLEMVR